MDSIIVAVIMTGMITTGIAGIVYATKKGNSGFISSVKYKQKREDEPEAKHKR